MKTTLTLLLLLNSAMIGCGTDWQAKVDEESAKAAKNNSGKTEAVETEKASAQPTDGEVVAAGAAKPVAKESTAGDVNVTVNVNVSVTVNEGQDNQFDLVFDPALKTWDEAVKTAPKGYRLPTRVELLQATLDHDLGTDTVWTSETWKGVAGKVWAFDLNSGKYFEFCTCFVTQTVYVRGVK